MQERRQPSREHIEVKPDQEFNPFEGLNEFPPLYIPENDLTVVFATPIEFQGVKGHVRILADKTGTSGDGLVTPLGPVQIISELNDGEVTTKQPLLLMDVVFEVDSLEECTRLVDYQVQISAGEKKFNLELADSSEIGEAKRAFKEKESYLMINDGIFTETGEECELALPQDPNKLSSITLKFSPSTSPKR